jgi:hypothetical protein
MLLSICLLLCQKAEAISSMEWSFVPTLGCADEWFHLQKWQSEHLVWHANSAKVLNFCTIIGHATNFYAEINYR